MLRISSELTRCHRDRFYLHLTLDVSVRNRNGRSIFSKYCTMAGTRHTARGNPIYVQANAASRHAVSICQSTWFYCPPQWLLTKSYLSFFPSHLSLSLPFSLLFFVICTPNRAELLQYGSGGGSVCRQQKISNKSFRNPASLLSASPDFHYSLLCHLRILSKLFPFPLASPLSSCQERNLLYRFYIFPPLVTLFSTRIILFLYFFFFFFYILVFSLHFDQPARSFRFPFFCTSSLIHRPLYRVISVQVSALIAFVSYASPAWTSIATSSPFRRTVITISGAAGYDWKRDSSEFRNYVRHSRERQPELVVMPSGERDKEIYWNSANKEIFLSYLSSFFWAKSRTIQSIPSCMCVRHPLLLVYLSRYYYIIERILARIGSSFVWVMSRDAPASYRHKRAPVW